MAHLPSESEAEALELRLRAAEEENCRLQRLAEYRSIFLSRLGHELRTPLTSILGFAEILLSQEELTDPQRGFCRRIQNSAQQLRGILDQLSDLTRLVKIPSHLVMEGLSIDELVKDSLASVTLQAQKQKVGLKVPTLANLPAVVSDRNGLRQVLYNFVSYAVARSPEGSEVIVDAEPNSRGVLILIRDEGTPLAAPGKFGEIDSANKNCGYSELGLAIARQTVELIGAKLDFENRETRGLLISILLPLAKAAEEPSSGSV